MPQQNQQSDHQAPAGKPESRARVALSIAGDIAAIAAACGIAIVGTVMILLLLVARAPEPAERAPDAKGRVDPVQAVIGQETSITSSAARPLDAHVALVEFADYECPYCGMYARDVRPRILKEFVSTGRLAYVFRDFPLESIHPLALGAAEAARCAQEQGRFWEMHDHLFEPPRRLTAPDLRSHALTVGLDQQAFDACVQTRRTTSVQADMAEGSRLGVTGTPTFFVGAIQADGRVSLKKRINGTPDYRVFKAVIESVLTTAVARRD